ncbi:hypothetical protein SDJN03_28460, partial [Cucurbita argyrosperma subsp. sororia]
MYVTDMDVFKNLDPGTSNVDLGNEGQPVEETAPAEAVPEPAAQSASRDQPTVVITLEALQSLIESRVDQAMQSRVDQAVQAALAGLGSQAAPTAPVSGQTTLVSETLEVGVQTVTPPTRLTELPDFVTAYNAAVKLDASTPRNNQGSSSQTRYVTTVARLVISPEYVVVQRTLI